MGDCCGQPADILLAACPRCGQPGRKVARMTLKALLRPEALPRLKSGDYRFCRTSACPYVYYGLGESFDRKDVLVPVFQKEAEGARTVCYCFAVSEATIHREVETAGVSASAERIEGLVRAGRCACEVRNPQGTCCLGNVFAIVKAAGIGTGPPAPDELGKTAVDE